MNFYAEFCGTNRYFCVVTGAAAGSGAAEAVAFVAAGSGFVNFLPRYLSLAAIISGIAANGLA